MGKYCSPSYKIAEASISMSEAKKQCSDDSSCNMFYKSGNSGKYYKCNKGATVKTSRYALSSLQIKGTNPELIKK